MGTSNKLHTKLTKMPTSTCVSSSRMANSAATAPLAFKDDLANSGMSGSVVTSTLRCGTGARRGSQRVLSLPGCAAALIALPIFPFQLPATNLGAPAAPAQAAIPSYELAAHVLTASRFSRPLGAG